MPTYKSIDATTPDGKRTGERLLLLREALRAQIPQRTNNSTLLLATWNIRDFDRPQYGDRLDEAIQYIAEIVAAFDIVAIQEVYRDLSALKRLMDCLGPTWSYLITDTTEGDQGNDERLCYVYDNNKIRFGGLCGEIVLPPEPQDDGTILHPQQIWRTPFIVGFEAGWSRFMLATVHILWGASVADEPRRTGEIRRLAEFLRARTEDDTAWARNLILLGDFNIFRPGNDAFNALTDEGFIIPEMLQTLPSNATRVRHYDQIAFREQRDRLDFTDNAGVFNYYDIVFTENDQELYIADMGEAYDVTSRGTVRTEPGKRLYFKTYWRTHQMSDHLPMWIELKIDYSDEYLRRKLDGTA